MVENLHSQIVLSEYLAENLGAPFKVILVDSVRQIVNKKTREVTQTIIPNQRGLLQQIALARICIPRKLSGQEIKFIRKAILIRATVLADQIGVSPEHLSRCEAGERVLSVGTEKCLRISVLLEHFKLPNDAEDVAQENEITRKKLIMFESAMSRMTSIIKEMNIPAVHKANNEICLYFKAVSRSEPNLFNDEMDGDWEDVKLLAA
jgi:DNA-binding transcriptional regulator YiaG